MRTALREDPGTLDQQRMQRLAARDQSALEELYDEYGGKAYSLALAILHDRREAEGVVQLVFLKVWRQAERYDHTKASVGTWLTAITRNQAIDRLRRLGRRPERLSLEELPLGNEPAAAGDAFDQAAAGQQRRVILKALAELPPEQRQVLLLAYYRGLSQSQVAEHLGQPLGTVKTRIRLGLNKLRRRLKARFRP